MSERERERESHRYLKYLNNARGGRGRGQNYIGSVERRPKTWSKSKTNWRWVAVERYIIHVTRFPVQWIIRNNEYRGRGNNNIISRPQILQYQLWKCSDKERKDWNAKQLRKSNIVSFFLTVLTRYCNIFSLFKLCG